MVRGCIRVAALLVGLLAGLFSSGASAWAAGPFGAAYVALGDSYAAGEGLGGIFNGFEGKPVNTASDPVGSPNKNPKKNTCHRSQKDAYAVFRRNNKWVVRNDAATGDRAFYACSGATATDMMTNVGDPAQFKGDPQNNIAPGIGDGRFQYGQPDQTTVVGANTKWISISAGGNDAKFGPVGKACATVVYPTSARSRSAISVGKLLKLSGTCATNLNMVRDQILDRHPTTADLPTDQCGVPLASVLTCRLRALYKAILDRGPTARLAVVGYPRIFQHDTSTGQSLGLTPQQLAANGLDPSSLRLCATNTTGRGTLALGVTDTDVPRLNDFIDDLNLRAQQAIQSLQDAGYSARIGFVDTTATAVQQDCTGHLQDPSINGLVLAKGSLPTLGICLARTRAVGRCGDILKKNISGATFHPTAKGQERFADALEAFFATPPPPPPPPPPVPGPVGGSSQTIGAGYLPSWSYDGRWLAFLATPQPSGVPEVDVWDSTTGRIARSAPVGDHFDPLISWARDAPVLTFSAYIGDPRNRLIATWDPAGGFVQWTPSTAPIYDTSVSGDGAYLAGRADASLPPNPQGFGRVYLMSRASATLRSVDFDSQHCTFTNVNPLWAKTGHTFYAPVAKSCAYDAGLDHYDALDAATGTRVALQASDCTNCTPTYSSPPGTSQYVALLGSAGGGEMLLVDDASGHTVAATSANVFVAAVFSRGGPQGPYLLAVTDDTSSSGTAHSGRLIRMDFTTGSVTVIGSWKNDTVDISPDAHHALWADGTGTHYWSAATNAVISVDAATTALMPGIEHPPYSAWSPDGTKLAFQGRGGFGPPSYVWNVATNTSHVIFDGISSDSFGGTMFWSSDSNFLARASHAIDPGRDSASDFSRLDVWSAATGTSLPVLTTLGQTPILEVPFVSDGVGAGWWAPSRDQLAFTDRGVAQPAGVGNQVTVWSAPSP